MLRTFLFLIAVFVGGASVASAQRVTEVKNGETIVVDGVGEVRLLGIESADESPLRVGRGTTPPAQPRRGPEQPPPSIFSGAISLKPKRPGRELLQRLVLGRIVRLEYEETAEGVDKEQAYVFVEDTLINAELLRKGLATVDNSQFSGRLEFMEAQQEAQDEGVGIWVQPR